MKKNRKKIICLLMAAAVFTTSGVRVSASEADTSGAAAAAGTEAVLPEEDAAAAAGAETVLPEENAAAAETDGAADGAAAPVEGTVEIPQEDLNQNPSDGTPADEVQQQPLVEGDVIVDKNNDDVKIEENDRPYLSLGADLTEEQRNTVLSLMGIDPADLADYDVVYVTNAEEHQYLDSYISASQIGSKSWSSVVIVEREKGNGLNISTNNITYCTVGMYKNALTTAGVTDADIIVAGPTGISGTAALVGIFKAYQEMTGETIEADVVDAALNELVITGQLESTIEGLTNEEVEEFIAYIKAVIAENDLSDEASINEVIDEACDKYGVTLTDSERQQIIDLLLKITSLGIDLNGLVDYAESLYNSYKSGGDASGVFASIGSFFTNVFSAIADFFKSFFS